MGKNLLRLCGGVGRVAVPGDQIAYSSVGATPRGCPDCAQRGGLRLVGRPGRLDFARTQRHLCFGAGTGACPYGFQWAPIRPELQVRQQHRDTHQWFQWAPIRPEPQDMCRKSFLMVILRQKYLQKTRLKRPLSGPKSSVFCEFFIALCPT